MAGEQRIETVIDLQRLGVLLVEDGNHGEYRPLPTEFVEVGTPFVRPDDLKNGRVDFASCDRINDRAVGRVRKGKGIPGDILFTHRATVGRIARVGHDTPNFVANPGVTIYRLTSSDILDPDFLYFFMQTSVFMNQVWAEAGNTDTFPYVSLTQQRGLKISFPCMKRQRSIAHVLGMLDDKIDLNRRMNETLEAMARAIFKDWFVDFGPTRAKMEGRAPYLAPELWSLFPDLLDNEGKPQGWGQVAAHEMVEFNPPERLLRGQPALYLDMAALPTTGSWAEAPTSREFVSGSKFRNGDALLARITPCLENGKTALVQNLDEGTVGWGSTEFIVMRARPPMPRAYSYILARNSAFRERAIQSMTGTSGRQRVQVNSLAEFELVKPTDEVARAFDELVSPSFDKVAVNANEIDTLAATRDLLLPKLMSGEIRIKDAEKIAEAAQ
jgi:type I restriction enzyme S subunit